MFCKQNGIDLEIKKKKNNYKKVQILSKQTRSHKENSNIF